MTTTLSDPITKAVRILNEALDLDPEAMTRIINLRVPCDRNLGKHPSIRIHRLGDEHRIGILGLINGIFDDWPSGAIGAEGQLDDAGHFIRIKRFVDLRDGKLDFLA